CSRAVLAGGTPFGFGGFATAADGGGAGNANTFFPFAATTSGAFVLLLLFRTGNFGVAFAAGLGGAAAPPLVFTSSPPPSGFENVKVDMNAADAASMSSSVKSSTAIEAG